MKKNNGTPTKARVTKKKPMQKRYNAHGRKEKFLPVKHPECINRPPRDVKEINKLADRLVQWAQTDDALTLDDFALKEKISPYRFKRMAPEHSYFQQALEYARASVGSRLFKLGLFKKADSSLVSKTLPLYNEEYRQFILEKQDKQTQGIINVVMDKFPETTEVKPIEDNDE